MDIEHFPMDFKVDAFYATMNSSVKDTLYENSTGNRFFGSPIAFQNIMPKYTNDTLAFFGTTCFESIEMVENTKGEFVGLSALNESDGLNNFQQLLAYMESKHGKPVVAEGNSFRQFFTYSWDLEDRELVLLVMGKEQEYISGLLGMKNEPDTVSSEAVEPPVINTIVFVFNKKFGRTFITTKVKSGDFLRLDSLSFSSNYLEGLP